MMSPNTDWSKIRYIMYLLFFVSDLLASTVAKGLATSGKQKRQLFREHLLPQQGGKIPESAFRPERIMLNKYQQIGLYVPDGIHLQNRHPVSHSPKPLLSNTLKVTVHPDNTHVAPPGRYFEPQLVDTTYLLREPVTYIIYPNTYNYRYLPATPYMSIQLISQSKEENKLTSSHKKINPLQDYSTQVLLEFSPLLQKLHEVVD